MPFFNHPFGLAHIRPVEQQRRLGQLGLPGVWQALGVPQGGAANQIEAAGYRLGDTVVVPGGGDGVAGPDTLVAWVGTVQRLRRFKIQLQVRALAQAVIDDAEGDHVVFTIESRTENDTITRTVTIRKGGAAVIYTPGRALKITANGYSETTDGAFQVSYSLDEAEAGISEWETIQEIRVAASVSPTVNTLVIPPFAKTLEVLTSYVNPSPTLFGYYYEANGTASYVEMLAVPRSGQIPIAPNLSYTLSVPSFGTDTVYTVRYVCEG